jgi:hypothetical protein
MNRPSIFLSSTIFDFRDLRSALKSYLEERGCRVLASEFNDFTKPVDKHSYQACLDSIEQSDIFVLLVGTRVGGWFDKTSRTSITQQEYRRAYELAKVGKLRILTFVRDEVWTHWQGVKELERYLKSLTEVDVLLREKIIRHPSSFADDAAFIHAFISEISRNKETAAAAEGAGAMPVANWVHTFKDFSGIADAITPLVLSGLAVRDAAGRTVLLNQILALLQGIMSPSKNGLFAPFAAIRKLAKDLNLGTGNLTGKVTLSKDQWNRIVVLGLHAHRAAPAIESIAAGLNSDLLLDYRPETGAFRPSEAYDVLTELVDQARWFGKAQQTADWAKFMSHGKNHDKNWSVSVPILEVAGELSLLLRWADTILLAKALAIFLDGKPLVRPEPMPLTPFLDQQEGVANEKTTLAQVRAFVGID